MEFSINKNTLRMFAMQKMHIQKLEEQLKQNQSEFFRAFMEIPKWELFILKHTSSYQRPENALDALTVGFDSMEIEYDNYKKNEIPSMCRFIISYRSRRNWHSSTKLKLRTNLIDIEDINNFMENQII